MDEPRARSSAARSLAAGTALVTAVTVVTGFMSHYTGQKLDPAAAVAGSIVVLTTVVTLAILFVINSQRRTDNLARLVDSFRRPYVEPAARGQETAEVDGRSR